MAHCTTDARRAHAHPRRPLNSAAPNRYCAEAGAALRSVRAVGSGRGDEDQRRESGAAFVAPAGTPTVHVLLSDAGCAPLSSYVVTLKSSLFRAVRRVNSWSPPRSRSPRSVSSAGTRSPRTSSLTLERAPSQSGRTALRGARTRSRGRWARDRCADAALGDGVERPGSRANVRCSSGSYEPSCSEWANRLDPAPATNAPLDHQAGAPGSEARGYETPGCRFSAQARERRLTAPFGTGSAAGGDDRAAGEPHRCVRSFPPWGSRPVERQRRCGEGDSGTDALVRQVLPPAIIGCGACRTFVALGDVVFHFDECNDPGPARQKLETTWKFRDGQR